MHLAGFTKDEHKHVLFVSDAGLLVRERKMPGQYPASVAHDTMHANNILSLGDEMWHIVCRGDARSAFQLLDRVFYAYVDKCCLELWCDARVCYIVDGETVRVDEYGFDDGQYSLLFNVYCNVAEDQTEEFLATLLAEETDRFIVVRPHRPGVYSAHEHAVDQSDESEYDDSDDEDPLAGDIEPTGGYYEPPVHGFDAHRLSVMRQHGDYTG